MRRLSVEMKKELLLMLLSFSCKRKGGEECNNKKERRFFFKLCSSSGPQAPLLLTPTLLYFSFILSFSQKYPTEQHIHTGERQRERERFTILLLTPQCVCFFCERWIFSIEPTAENSLFFFFCFFHQLWVCVCVFVHSNVYFMYLPNRSFPKFQHSHWRRLECFLKRFLKLIIQTKVEH